MIRPSGSIQTLQDIGPWFGTALLVVVLGIGAPHGAAGQPADVQALLDRGSAAGANVEQMRTVVERARRAGLSTDATASLLDPVVALAENDLPAGPLLSKTLEGLAKKVPAARMQPVLQQYRAHTEQAGEIVGAWAERGEVRQLLGVDTAPSEAASQAHEGRTRLITVVTEARQQGVSPKNIESFLSGLPEGVERRPVSMNEVAAAVNVLPDLPGNGASPEASTRLLTAALNAGYSPESLRQLPSALQSARQASNRPIDALAQGTAQAIARGTPATSVLQSLFQGSFPGGGPPAGVGNGPPGQGSGNGTPPNSGGPDNPPGSGGPPGDPGGGP